MKRYKAVLLLVLLTFATGMLQASGIPLGPHKVEFVGYDAATYTWTYNVTSLSPPTGCQIYYWIIAWCGGPDSIVDASHPYTYGFDPETNIRGIKFDYHFEYNVTVTFWFQLDKDYAMGDVEVAIKEGNNLYTGTIIGPVFTYTFDLKVLISTPANKMFANASTDCPTITSVRFSWYGPFGPSVTPWADPTKLNHTTTISAPGPYEEERIVKDIDIGSWYVTAEFLGGYHQKTLYDTLDVTEVPWFTSLPLVLLITVAFMAFLRRKGSTSLHT